MLPVNPWDIVWIGREALPAFCAVHRLDDGLFVIDATVFTPTEFRKLMERVVRVVRYGRPVGIDHPALALYGVRHGMVTGVSRPRRARGRRKGSWDISIQLAA